MVVQYFCDSGSTNKLFYMPFLLSQEANEVILDVWLLGDFGRRKITQAA